MRRDAVLFLVAGLLLLAPAARGGEPEEQAAFHRAERLAEEGRFEEAMGAFKALLAEGGLDGRFAVRCHLGMADCLCRLGRTEDAARLLEEGRERYRASEDARRAFEARLGKLGERLRGDEGPRDGAARGEDRRRHRDEEARHRDEEARHRAEEARRELERKIERMVRLWEEGGVSGEEIEARVRRVREQHERTEAARRETEALARRLEQEGATEEEVRREIERMERRLRAEMDEGWRGRREEEMEQARREFLHLAERLGIPVEEAERFLDEHLRRRRPEPHRGEEPGDGRLHGLLEKVEAMEAFLFRLEENLGKVLHRLETLERRLSEAETR